MRVAPRYLEVQWSEIPYFEGYSVSISGQVRNDVTGSILAKMTNRQGVVYVGLTRGRQHFSRVVSRLVASAFMEPDPREPFDSLIHLDGDRFNSDISNLMWRPRMFAMKYNNQFLNRRLGTQMTIEEVGTGEIFTPRQAAMKYGLLIDEVSEAAMNYTAHHRYRDRVWPTGQQFRILS